MSSIFHSRRYMMWSYSFFFLLFFEYHHRHFSFLLFLLFLLFLCQVCCWDSKARSASWTRKLSTSDYLLQWYLWLHSNFRREHANASESQGASFSCFSSWYTADLESVLIWWNQPLRKRNEFIFPDETAHDFSVDKRQIFVRLNKLQNRNFDS